MSNEAIRTSELDRYQRNMSVQMEKQGYEAVEQGDFAKAHYHFYFAYSHLLTIYQRVPKDKKNEGFLLSASAQALLVQGSNPYGEKLAQESIDAFQAYLQTSPCEEDIYEVNNYIARCHTDIAGSAFERNIFSAAIYNYQLALNIYKKMNYPNIGPLVECLIQLSIAYSRIELYDFSIALINDAISRITLIAGSLRADIALSRQLADCYGMLGFVYTAKGDHIKSVENYTLQDNILSQFHEEVSVERGVEEIQYTKSTIATSELSTAATSELIEGESHAQISQSRPRC